MHNEEKVTFKKHYLGLTTQEQKHVRDSFINEAEIAYPTFYSKLSRDHYSALEKKALERICGRSFSWD